MNSVQATALVAIIGLIVNGIWTVLNVRLEAAVLRKVDEIKDYMADRYALESVCRDRHEELGRRIEQLEA